MALLLASSQLACYLKLTSRVIKLTAVSHQLTNVSSPTVLYCSRALYYLSGSLYCISKSVVFHPSADSVCRQTAVIRHAAHKGQIDTGGRLDSFGRVELRRSGKAKQQRTGDSNVRDRLPRRQMCLLKIANQRIFNLCVFTFGC